MVSTMDLVGGSMLVRAGEQYYLMRCAVVDMTARSGGDDCDDWYETVG